MSDSQFPGYMRGNLQVASRRAWGVKRRSSKSRGKRWSLVPPILLRPLFPNLCVVTASPEVQQSAGVPAIADHFAKRGPLGGIHAALSHFQAPTFIVACDMPFLRADFIRFLVEQWSGLDALLPDSDDGLAPLHAIYAPLVFANFRALFTYGKTAFDASHSGRVTSGKPSGLRWSAEFDEKLRLFENWNSPEDISAHSSGDSS